MGFEGYLRSRGHDAVPGKSSGGLEALEGPGKRSAHSGEPIQAKRAPDGPTPAPIDPASIQADQYGPNTDPTHANDCGPAVVLMVIRAMGAQAQLDKRVAAWFGVKSGTAIIDQQRFDYLRSIAGDTGKGTMSAVSVRASLVATLGKLGVKLDEEKLKKLLPFIGDQQKGGVYGAEKDVAFIDAFLKAHCGPGTAVIGLGDPRPAWGWGGDDKNEAPNRRVYGTTNQSIPDNGLHFVLIWSPRPGTYTVMDPAWKDPRDNVSIGQIHTYLNQGSTTTLVTLMGVPFAQIQQYIPDNGVQKKARSDAPTNAPGASQPTGPGAPLPPPTRARMEAALFSDFGDVRIHEGGHVEELGARAFARGNELHFAPGEYRPGTPEGDRLIGHELAHVIQQRKGRVAGGGMIDDPSLEAEADAHGDRIAGLDTPNASAGHASLGPTTDTDHAPAIQRKPKAGPPTPKPAVDVNDANFTALKNGLDPLIPSAQLTGTATPDSIVDYLRHVIEAYYSSPASAHADRHAKQLVEIEEFRSLYQAEVTANSANPLGTAAKKWNDGQRSAAIKKVVGDYLAIPVSVEGVSLTFRAPYNINLDVEKDGPGEGKNSPQEIARLAQGFIPKELLPKLSPDARKTMATENPSAVSKAITDLCRSKRVGVDCAGFVFNVTDQADQMLGGNGFDKTAYTATSTGADIMTGTMSTPVKVSELQPGDTLGFGPDGHHIAMVTTVAATGSSTTIGVAHSNETVFLQDDRSGIFAGTAEIPNDAALPDIEKILRGIEELMGEASTFTGFFRFKDRTANKGLATSRGNQGFA